jgi:hypothetical protein
MLLSHCLRLHLLRHIQGYHSQYLWCLETRLFLVGLGHLFHLHLLFMTHGYHGHHIHHLLTLFPRFLVQNILRSQIRVLPHHMLLLVLK